MILTLDLRGRLAVVTGATSELGRCMARTLAECGADVVVHYHQAADRAAELAEEIRGRGVRCLVVQADVTSEASVNAMRDRAQEEMGDPDILVNNAVIPSGPWQSVLTQPLEGYEQQFRSSVLHNVLMARAFVPGMIRRRGGRIIGINTECSMRSDPGQSAYVSGKRGMDGVLRVLAKEVGPHQITVNQVAPGWMITDKDRAAGSEIQDEYDRSVPLRHRGEDQDIANMVAFLASDLAKFVSGAYIPVCGGHVMPCI